MKKVAYIIFFLVVSISLGYSQTLPLDFEGRISRNDFFNFAGAITEVIVNPHIDSSNASAKVVRLIRNGGEVFAGSKLTLNENLDFSENPIISMKVWTAAPAGTVIKMKLEGFGETYRDVVTTVSEEWETLRWDFTGQPTNFNSLVFMFDFGSMGDGSESSVFLFDDVEQVGGGLRIDWPVDFEDPKVNYSMHDFGGNISSLTSDPDGSDNQVIKVVKSKKAKPWAGTTIGSFTGFASNIPLSLSEPKMLVRVWSPQADIPIRLKVENANDPDHSCETETRTTVAGEWETLEFNFLQHVLKTPSLKTGIERGFRFNKASIFFNYGTDGKASGERIYYFDDVEFVNINMTLMDIENLKTKYESQIKLERFVLLTVIVFLIFGFVFYIWSQHRKYKNVEEKLNLEILGYKEKLATQSLGSMENRQKIALDKDKIEKEINAKIGETSWMILNLLVEDPAIGNKEIAKKVSLSLEGVSSSLRRMYSVFGLKSRGNKKVALVMKIMQILIEK